MLARSKLNSVERMVSQALIDLEISHKEYRTIIDEEEKYRIQKENIKLMESRRSDVEKDKSIKDKKN